MFAENTAVFLTDFGVSAVATVAGALWTCDGSVIQDFSQLGATCDGSTTRISQALVLFDEPGADLLGGRVISTQYEISYRTADLPGLVNGMSITVNGTQYTVIDAKTVDDGVFSIAHLEL